MSKQLQVLPCMPYAQNGGLFGNDSLTVYYQEWNRTNKSYRTHSTSVADTDEANAVMEYLKVCRILEPLIRFLTGQELLIVKDFGNHSRLKPVSNLKKALTLMLQPKNQTCQCVAECFYQGVGKAWAEAMPGNKSKYWERANLLLEEIRAFTRQHRAANAVAA